MTKVTVTLAPGSNEPRVQDIPFRTLNVKHPLKLQPPSSLITGEQVPCVEVAEMKEVFSRLN
jgi:hypothetical protein